MSAPLLLRLPLLFSPTFVTPDTHLSHLEGVARRMQRLMRLVLCGVLVLSTLALTGLVSDTGFLLPWAATQWPAVFNPLLELAQQPMSQVELIGSVVILLLFLAVYARESSALRAFREDLDVVFDSSSVRDALRRMEASSEPVAAYVAAVTLVRPLRLGDWRVARALTEQPKK